MANCKAELGLGQSIVNLKHKKDIYNNLYGLVSMDNDLTENEDYFQDDTLELGFKNEAERIVKETLAEFGHPTTIERFRKVANKVFESISTQEYFGVCEISVIQAGKNKVALAYAYGGAYGI
tara:strand:- start:113 stop:478 length:366 start_codon:yes stop_codon:yes gene_type:complete